MKTKGMALNEAPELNAEQRKRLKQLADLPEAEIDIVDIPEAPALSWMTARRPNLYRPVKKQITIRLDEDVLAWFRANAASGYQTAINNVLRRFMIEMETDREGEGERPGSKRKSA